MKSAIFKGKENIVVEEVPKPTIQDPTDAIVRVVYSCVCGSDLWFYRGIANHDEGPVGHEFIGVVEETGSEVEMIKEGDFVIGPFAYSCGTCPNCQAGFQTACLNGGYFGGGAGKGCQAEYIHVPWADGTLVSVPGEDFSEDTMKSLLTLSDVMATGYHAAVSAGVKAGDTVAVVGDGAVGLSAVLSSKLLGAERIIIMSKYPDRQELARKWGATDIVEVRGEEAIEKIKGMTEGVGADAVMECVGTEEATNTAFAITRPGGIVGRVGLPQDEHVDAIYTFRKNKGMRGGPAPVRAYLPELMKAVLEGKINPGEVFTFTTDLDGIADAYAAMHERRAIKSLLKVSEL